MYDPIEWVHFWASGIYPQVAPATMGRHRWVASRLHHSRARACPTLQGLLPFWRSPLLAGLVGVSSL
jgi:hypothetical protein